MCKLIVYSALLTIGVLDVLSVGTTGARAQEIHHCYVEKVDTSCTDTNAYMVESYRNVGGSRTEVICGAQRCGRGNQTGLAQCDPGDC